MENVATINANIEVPLSILEVSAMPLPLLEVIENSGAEELASAIDEAMYQMVLYWGVDGVVGNKSTGTYHLLRELRNALVEMSK